MKYDKDNKLYYFVNRYYDPTSLTFNSRDALFEQKPFFSPYAYCRNNPLRYIDPDGRDEWEFDQCGNFLKRIENTEFDQFRVVSVDADGNRTVMDETSKFAYGTVEHKQQSTNIDGISVGLDVFNIQGDANATETFEMFANNTPIEWGHAKVGGYSQEKNVLLTSHEESAITGANMYLLKNHFVKEYNHNHPGGTRYPSGTKTGKDDCGVARRLEGENPFVKTSIYIKYGTYIQYNQSGVIK